MLSSNRQNENFDDLMLKNYQLEANILAAVQISEGRLKDQIKYLRSLLERSKNEGERLEVMEGWEARNSHEVSGLSERLSSLSSEKKRQTIREKVLHSLYFPEVNERLARIASAHRTTFQWIWRDGSEPFTQRASIANWLSGDREFDGGMYWITGKPG